LSKIIGCLTCLEKWMSYFTIKFWYLILSMAFSRMIHLLVYWLELKCYGTFPIVYTGKEADIFCLNFMTCIYFWRKPIVLQIQMLLWIFLLRPKEPNVLWQLHDFCKAWCLPDLFYILWLLLTIIVKILWNVNKWMNEWLSQCSSVKKGTGYRLHNKNLISLHHDVPTGSEAHVSFSPMGTWVIW
jgi:hypothetical protein